MTFLKVLTPEEMQVSRRAVMVRHRTSHREFAHGSDVEADGCDACALFRSFDSIKGPFCKHCRPKSACESCRLGEKKKGLREVMDA